MTTQAQIESINKAFRIPPPDMPKLFTATTRPSYDTLHPFQRALDKNAMSIPCSQSVLGYLALTRSTADYSIASSAVLFVEPVDPGSAPTAPVLQGGTSTASIERRAAQIEIMPFTSQETIRAFTAKKPEYLEFVAVSTALKNLILTNIAPEYLDAIKNPLTEFATVTVLELMTHLWTTYGTIDQGNLSENETRMKQSWMPPTPIEFLFKQLRDGQLFAAKGSEQISDQNLQHWAYDNILATGLFNTPCREWRTTSTSKTWKTFQVHFAKADLDRKNSTTADASYTANQVQELVQNEMLNFISQLDQFAPSSDPSSFVPPSSITNPVPPASSSTSINSANSALTTASIQQLITDAISQAIPASLPPRTNRHRARSTVGKTSNRTTSTHGPKPAQALVDGFPVTYCWTHGITRNLAHNSETCQHKADGHKEDATFNSRKSGSSATVGSLQIIDMTGVM